MIDITVGLSTDVAPWPGDSPLVLEWPVRLGDEWPINLSKISFSPHLGTHVDAPLHFLPNGETSEQTPLTSLIGDCLVLDLSCEDDQTLPICVAELGSLAEVQTMRPPAPLRVLLKTGYQRQQPFNTSFRYPLPQTVDWLAERGAVLLGSDAPSMDHFHSKTLDGHRSCHRHGITVLENLELSQVSSGWYQILALPLLLPGGEAAPARVILLSP